MGGSPRRTHIFTAGPTSHGFHRCFKALFNASVEETIACFTKGIFCPSHLETPAECVLPLTVIVDYGSWSYKKMLDRYRTCCRVFSVVPLSNCMAVQLGRTHFSLYSSIPLNNNAASGSVCMPISECGCLPGCGLLYLTNSQALSLNGIWVQAVGDWDMSS